MIKDKNVIKALTVIAKWFLTENEKDYKKPITLIDTDVEVDGEHFRIMTHMSFYGRNEIPTIKKVKEK